MCIYECNYELLTNEDVRWYWDELSVNIVPTSKNAEATS